MVRTWLRAFPENIIWTSGFFENQKIGKKENLKRIK